jgi:hypothetical protein
MAETLRAGTVSGSGLSDERPHLTTYGARRRIEGCDAPAGINGSGREVTTMTTITTKLARVLGFSRVEMFEDKCPARS